MGRGETRSVIDTSGCSARNNDKTLVTLSVAYKSAGYVLQTVNSSKLSSPSVTYFRSLLISSLVMDLAGEGKSHFDRMGVDSSSSQLEREGVLIPAKLVGKHREMFVFILSGSACV